MNLIHFVPTEPKLDFLGKTKIFHAITLIIVLGSIGLFFTKGLNYGVDFRGGTLLEIETERSPADLQGLRANLNGLGLGDVSLQEFGEPNLVLINLPRQDGGEDAQQAALREVRQALEGDVAEYRRTESVGPKVGSELRLAAAVATLLSMLGIVIYVWVRFDLVYGGAALAALVHDVLAVIGFYALTGIEFNLATLAAVLTVAGYSINDTVVLFDRVREELRRFKKLPVPQVLNKAINATLSRTILTTATTLLALFGLFFFGGEVIRGFAAGIIVGILLGTYSSWAVAVPLLNMARLRPAAPTGDKPEKVRPAV
ncbi:MAG: protein translocase subunit SecF [Rhodospirillales bacterium]|nr:protein translocase subunit SecF [Rhodospirillales bacterium]